MKNEIYDSMLSRYDLKTEQNKRNAIFEVNQQVILAGLYSGGFFESAAFYGGTCLRIFHGLQRFSEDTWYIVHGKTELRDAIGTTLNGMYAIMYPWILYICLKDASNSMTKILL